MVVEETQVDKRKILLLLLTFLFLLSYAVTGYIVIEDWEIFDAIYMTFITVSTVGYGETHTLSDYGRMHTIVVILTCVGFYSYMLVYISSLFIEGKIKGVLTERSMESKIKNLENHYIICGYGRIGREVCEGFKTKKNMPFVVLDNNDNKLESAFKEGYLIHKGDATDDETLIHVGVKKAKGIVCALPDDALNVFITLTTRFLNPQVNIIARADKSESVDKLKRAGAHTVVAPYIIGGRRMASAVLQPEVFNFLDVLLVENDFDLQLEELKIGKDSVLAGHSFKSAEIREKTGCIVVAIKKHGGKAFNNFSSEIILSYGDILIVMGSKEQLLLLNKITN